MAFFVLIAMIWLDWNFPTHMYYSPNLGTDETVSIMLLFKKVIELGLSFCLVVTTVAVLRLKQSGNVERFLASVAMGVGTVFWLHRDLIYLLLH